MSRIWTPPGSRAPEIKFDEKGRALVEIDDRDAGSDAPPRVVRLAALVPVPNRADRRRAAKEARKNRAI